MWPIKKDIVRIYQIVISNKILEHTNPDELESIPEYAPLVPIIIKLGGFERCAEMFGFIYKSNEEVERRE